MKKKQEHPYGVDPAIAFLICLCFAAFAFYVGYQFGSHR